MTDILLPFSRSGVSALFFHPYEKSINPYNGQPRIAMTGCLLFSARKLIFLITGKNKTEVVYDILKSGDTGPAAYVAHHAADVDIFTDIEIDGISGYPFEVPLSSMLTMEKSVKQIPPNPASTRAGTK